MQTLQTFRATDSLRLRVRTRLAVVIVAMLLGSTAAVAQEDDGVSYKRKTVINFEDDTIEGDLKTPDGQYLETRKNMRHRSLIRIRRDFRREVLGSIADL
jgi:hypothetical protein